MQSCDLLDLIGNTPPDWVIATVLPDRAERYFSTGLL